MLIELQSLANLNPHGYLLNASGGLDARDGNVVHLTSCWLIPRMDLKTPKFWADTIDELRTVLEAQGGGLDPDRPMCLLCRPK